MAQYILDFEDTDYPYQAVIKSTLGGYIGQIPLSASLVAFTAGQASEVAQVTVLPMGGLGSTTIQFSQYDWANCVPAPSDFSTNAKIMAYLSTYFTGQAIAPTPPTITMSPIISNPTSLDLGVNGTYTATLVGIADIVAVQSENIGSIGACTIKKWVLTIGNNNADDVVNANIFKISSLGAKKIIATIPIKVGVVGIEVVEAIDTTILSDDLIGIEYIVPLGIGKVDIASSCIFVEVA